jgi:hypothetical protein
MITWALIWTPSLTSCGRFCRGSMVDEAAEDMRALELQGDGNPDAALAFDHISAIVRSPQPLLERLDALRTLSATKGRIFVKRSFVYPAHKAREA